jgi:2,4-dienoyl-CoA reductase-like NADH-dependent reductase (Old Yellow Enzyme family)
MLFEPLVLRDVTIRNRIFVAPMCQYSAVDGVPQTWHLVHLGGFAVGGAGLVLSEATAVSPEGRISPQDAGIWNDEQVAAWQPITAFVRDQGAVPGIQLAHAGRKASTYRPWEGRGSVPAAEGGWQSLGPDDQAFEGYDAPRGMTRADIAQVVADFAAGAQRADRAGFDVAEIHAAHGYLLHEFLSPLSNSRTDEYGGDLAGRSRLLVEVVEAVRAVWPEGKPLLVRFSGTDWVEGGWDVHETAEVAGKVQALGVDLADVSSGGNVARAPIPVGPGYQVPLARTVREEGGVLVGAVGLITDARQAEQVLVDGSADAVLLGRELLRDPHWPLRAAHELGVDVAWPPQYERAAWS